MRALLTTKKSVRRPRRSRTNSACRSQAYQLLRATLQESKPWPMGSQIGFLPGLGSSQESSRKKAGCPAWIRTTIDGVRVRSLTIRRRGIISPQKSADFRLRANRAARLSHRTGPFVVRSALVKDFRGLKWTPSRWLRSMPPVFPNESRRLTGVKGWPSSRI